MTKGLDRLFRHKPNRHTYLNTPSPYPNVGILNVQPSKLETVHAESPTSAKYRGSV